MGPGPNGAAPEKRFDLGRYWLLYTCPGCGETGLAEERMVRTVRRTGMRAQAELEQVRAAGLDRSPTEAQRERALRDMAQRLERGDWSPLERKVICPRCGAAQPWSGMGKPWPRTLLALISAIVLLGTLIYLRLNAVYIANGRGSLGAALIPLGAAVLLSLGYILRRRYRLEKQRRETEHRPAFYPPAKLRELLDSPYAHLAKPFLREDR